MEWAGVAWDFLAPGLASFVSQHQSQDPTFVHNTLNAMFGRQAAPQAQEQQAPEANQAAPPAARRAVAALPAVCVTREDLEDEANCTCCVCIDDFVLGEAATRLPCGHLFHRPCVEDWLSRHCTCPVCRYELPTDDGSFERGRRQRMERHRPRYRRSALKRKTVHELRRLCSAVGVDMRGCLEKQDLVRRLEDSGRVHIIEESPELRRGADASAPAAEAMGGDVPRTPARTVSSDQAKLMSMSVGQLKRLMSKLEGVDAENCLEKGDMVHQILSAKDYESLMVLGMDELASMSVRSLKSRLSELGMPCDDCIEKADLVKRLLSSQRVTLGGS